MRNATPTNTVKQFIESFANEGVTTALHCITSQQEYRDWKKVRNTLAHRISPGRNIQRGGPKLTTLMLQDIPINNTATAVRRRWLPASLRYLLTEADAFTVNKHF